jgi:hypothetical protein
MLKQSSIKNKIKSRSIRHPRNVWTVRLLAVFVILFSMDVDQNYVQDHMPGRGSAWVNNWITVNELDLPYSPESIENSYFAEVSEIDQNRAEVERVNHEVKQTQNNSGFTKYHTPEVISGIDRYEENVNLVSFNQDLTINDFTEKSGEDQVQERLRSELDYQEELQRAYAQSSRSDAFEMKKLHKPVSWLAQGSIGPQYSQGSIGQPSGQTYAEVSNIDNLVAEQQGVGSNTSNQAFSAMLNFGLTFGSNFELLSGVSFTQMDGSHAAYYDSQVEKTQTILTSRTNIEDGGVKSYQTIEEQVTYTNYFSDTLKANYRISSFEIPLVLKYNFGKQKINYFISSGVSTNIGSHYSANYESGEIGNGNINEVGYGINAVNILLGLGIQYKATKNISIQLSPGYKYGIPVSKSVYQSPVSSLGLFTGLNYYF